MKYGAKFRKIHNRVTNEWREVYTPVIYEGKKEIYVAKGDFILEFKTKEEAFKVAEEYYPTYLDYNKWKKITILTTTGGKGEIKTVNEPDEYFVNYYKNDPQTKKIIRQYYPLKDNKKVILWDNKSKKD